MRKLFLGHEAASGAPVRLPLKSFQTHYHLIGGTGKGKTTAIHTILHPLLLDADDTPCIIIWDRLGNLSYELLLWLASEFCTDEVRRRLVYIEPSREDVVIGMNPLLFETEDHCYFRVSRATDIILRAWEDVNIEAMPRLARWTFNAFYAAAQLGLTISDCVHFLLPGSPYHQRLLASLPDRLRIEWQELTGNRASEVLRTLDSSRNRIKPFIESGILRRMFGSTQNRLDVARFMREGRVVILNLAPQNRLSSQLGDAIGALVLNEVLACARSLPPHERYPTYLFLDEFQNFVGPDIEAAIPEVRQLGLRILLAHQSFAQLRRGDTDLTTMIFQAQSRMIFGVQGEDADLLAHELASIVFDPKCLKEEHYSRRQLVQGHRIVELTGWSRGRTQSNSWQQQYGQNWSAGQGRVMSPDADLPTRSESDQQGRTSNSSTGGGVSDSAGESGHQTLVPIHDNFLELSSRTYYTPEEQERLWAKQLRTLERGQALLRLVDSPQLLRVNVKRSAPGYLAWDVPKLHRELPEVLEAVERLKDQNFRSEFFTAPQVIDAEIEERLRRIVAAPIVVPALPAPTQLPATGPTPVRPDRDPNTEKTPLL